MKKKTKSKEEPCVEYGCSQADVDDFAHELGIILEQALGKIPCKTIAEFLIINGTYIAHKWAPSKKAAEETVEDAVSAGIISVEQVDDKSA